MSKFAFTHYPYLITHYWLEFVVLRRLAPRLVHRILLRVEGELLLARRRQVDVELVAQPHQEQQHVRGLQRHLGARVVRQVRRLLEREL